MLMPGVSVVVPCYNCENFINKTVNSLLNQTILPKEIILIDDNSSDNTIKVIKELEDKNKIIKVFNLKENKGPSFTRNYGVDKSKEQYILFMDSDDIALPYLIEKSFKNFNELNKDNKDKCVLSYTSYVQIDENDSTISNIMKGMQVETEEILGYEFLRNYISTSGVIINKEHFYNSGRFNENLNSSEDWDLWLRIATLGGFSYVDEPLIKVRRRKNSLSSKLKNMEEGEKSILKQYSLDFIEEAINKRKLPKDINTCDFVSMLFRLDYLEEGFEKLKKILENSDYYNVYFLLGVYYIKKHNLDLALESFNKTVELKENHGAALNNLGIIYCLMGQVEKGKKFFERALEMYPNYLDAKHNLNIISKKTSITYDSIKFTFRELRNTLINYEI
ncbi:glycosyltransferase [Clostridium botulinum]|uniref:Glycosyltransferase n=2 Tax=Clostridium botulinum TaxID=1491 RepID=A0A846HZA1_CLOBO|nr:glycosyltransferase [Clostridium botulinum]AJD26533.1 tetratricopeptide repeat family protein [Clostridium botulinum CDC_297]ACQ53214.1 putative glycosyl transferase [Clostridium botulinum Ba4 str. 657]APR01143.1 tetratricopeptide repeat family protein [Clostridium botulinum]APU61646.1 tetratricopeptide repeat family protein [Clostridium botulinum]AUN04144.1 glycosyl transferase [Clostridium botulinum]